MKRLLISLSILLLAAVPAAAIESHVGTVVSADDSTLVIETTDGETKIDWSAMEDRPFDLKKGDAVVIRYDGDAPSEILVVDEKVMVAESTPETYHAITGTVDQANTEHLILSTPSGQEAFVIYPDKLFPPFPEPGQRIALIYRETGTSSKYSQYAASEIIELDESFQLASDNVEVAYEDIEEPEETETQVARAEASVSVETDAETDEAWSDESYDAPLQEEDTYQTARALPQTASALPLIGLLGLLAALGWIALGIRR